MPLKNSLDWEHAKTCYKMFHDGTFPEVKSGRAYRVSRENFIDYLNKRRKDKPHD